MGKTTMQGAAPQHRERGVNILHTSDSKRGDSGLLSFKVLPLNCLATKKKQQEQEKEM